MTETEPCLRLWCLWARLDRITEELHRMSIELKELQRINDRQGLALTDMRLALAAHELTPLAIQERRTQWRM